MSEVDLPSWRYALDSRGTPTALRRTGHFGVGAAGGGHGIARRLLLVQVDPAGVRSDCWIGGDRVGLSGGLQRLVVDAAGSDKKWLIQWLHGRWPRGLTCVAFPLDRDDGTLTLGIAAPLAPTRVALSEGPLPFSASSVADFKDLHAASGAPGLAGCRLELRDGEVTRAICRWPIARTHLEAVAAQRGLGTIAAELAIPAIEGLSGSSKVPNLVVEAAWDPEPLAQLTVELGPVPARGLIGLTRVALGEAQADAMVDLAQSFGTNRMYRARLRFDSQGLAAVGALAGPRGQAATGRW